MNKEDWELLRNLVFGVAKTLQEGRHSTSDDWYLIQEDLERAAVLAGDEGDELNPETETK